MPKPASGSLALQLPAPPPAKQTSTTNRSEYEQQDDGSDSGICDRRDHAGTKVDAELGQQPGTYERSNYSDNEIAEQSEASALHDLAGQPSCDDACS
jgi:hypothetical protein